MRTPDVVRMVVLCVCYVATAKFGLSLDAVHSVATAVWPPTGIALVALVLGGCHLWPGITCRSFPRQSVGRRAGTGGVWYSAGEYAGGSGGYPTSPAPGRVQSCPRPPARCPGPGRAGSRAQYPGQRHRGGDQWLARWHDSCRDIRQSLADLVAGRCHGRSGSGAAPLRLERAWASLPTTSVDRRSSRRVHGCRCLEPSRVRWYGPQPDRFPLHSLSRPDLGGGAARSPGGDYRYGSRLGYCSLGDHTGFWSLRRPDAPRESPGTPGLSEHRSGDHPRPSGRGSGAPEGGCRSAGAARTVGRYPV